MTDKQEITKNKPKNLGGRPRKYKSVRQLTMAINRYFTDDVIPTKAGLALFLGFCSKDALNEYRNYEGFSDLIKKTFLKIETFWVEKLAKANSAGSAFWLKNNAGYVDKQEIKTTEDVVQEDIPPEVLEIYRKAGQEAMMWKLNHQNKSKESA